MKHKYFALVSCLIASVVLHAGPRESVSNIIREQVDLSGLNEDVSGLLEVFPQLDVLPEIAKKSMIDQFSQEVSQNELRELVVDEMTEEYLSLFSEQEIKQIEEFLISPAGRKYNRHAKTLERKRVKIGKDYFLEKLSIAAKDLESLEEAHPEDFEKAFKSYNEDQAMRIKEQISMLEKQLLQLQESE